MSSWRQQTQVDAPIAEIWDLICDPDRAPEWAEGVLAITGGPARIETQGSTYDVTARGPLGLKATTPFKVTEFEEMREVKMQCQVTGFYTHWMLTEAQGGTFTELELGVEELPQKRSLRGRTMTALHTKTFLRHAVEKTFDGLRRVLTRSPAS
jgi:Polyketide cyclase / dehydrase and lipid transport